MKVLITGSNGLLGQKLTSLLLIKGFFVIATSIGKNRFSIIDKNYLFISLDVTDSSQVNKIIDDHQPNVLINAAAMTNVDLCEIERNKCYELNVVAVNNLITACKRNDIHFIHVSTDFIFDGTFGPLSENEKPNPVNYYGETKLMSEQNIIKSGIKWCILRTVLVYGITNNMNKSNIVLWIMDSLRKKKNISIIDDQLRTPTLAEDLALGCYLSAKNYVEGIFNISGNEMLTPYQMAVIIADYFGLNKKLIEQSDSNKFAQTAKRPMKTGLIIDKARVQLGYEPHSFKEGLAIIEKFESNKG